MYHVIGTGVASIVLYLISYFFLRIGYYSIQFHRKLWNTVLATAFIITAFAGIFMALQITYKWNIPFIKQVIKWHVEAGTGMALTGIFHLLWHLSYFSKIFKRHEAFPVSAVFPEITDMEIRINLFIAGFVSSSVQLLLIREMMNISGGYELITGIFLGSWLTGSAIGSSIAGRSPLYDIRRINLIFAISPLISMFLMFVLSRLFLNTGETPSLLMSMIYTFIVLIPFTMVSGFTFIKLISAASSCNNFIPGKSFSIETTGGIAAGILLSILTSGLLNTYQLILLIILFSLAYVVLTFYLKNTGLKLALKVFITLLASCLILFKPDIVFRQILLPGIKVTATTDTPYGNITYGKYRNEQSIYYDHRLLAYNDDAIEREEDVHYAMLQSEFPEKVILVSGSLNSLLPELLKYPLKKIIYIERDPALIRSGISVRNTSSCQLVQESKDAFRYIRNTDESVDVVILLVPPPSTLQLNRYYTTEFFSEVKKKLNKDGLFVCSPGAGEDYLNKESVKLYSSVYNSLSAVFKNVKPVSGNKLYFIASDKELSLSFCKLAESRNIKNIYVSSDYLSDELITSKSNEVISLMDSSIRQNRSDFPVACFHFLSYEFSKNADEKIPAIVLLIIVFAVPVLAIRKRNLIMYFSASALAGLEIIVLLSLQIVAGNMYQLTGLVIAGVMAGLALGARCEIKLLNTFSLIMKGVFLVLFYICTGLFYNYIPGMNSGIPYISLIIISAFIPALLTGSIFRELTTNQESSHITSATYSADLAGSAFGFILVSGVSVPLFGIRFSLFLLSALIFTGLLFGTIKNK
jgi:spermidine synthase